MRLTEGGVLYRMCSPHRPLSTHRPKKRAEITIVRQTAKVFGIGSAAPQTTEGKLRQLKSMLDSGLITQSQYDAKQKQLLSNF